MENSWNGDVDYLKCSATTPCEDKEGDCDLDEDCRGDLICGANNCDTTKGFPSNADCCTRLTGDF